MYQVELPLGKALYFPLTQTPIILRLMPTFTQVLLAKLLKKSEDAAITLI